jgi:hypothetical protein
MAMISDAVEQITYRILAHLDRETDLSAIQKRRVEDRRGKKTVRHIRVQVGPDVVAALVAGGGGGSRISRRDTLCAMS